MIENYFDFFTENEYDITNFVKKWDLILSSDQTKVSSIKSLTTFLTCLDFDDYESFMVSYKLSDHETLEDISNKLYGTTDYWWIIIVINKMSYFDFPLTPSEIYSVASNLYELETKFSISGYKKIITKQNDIKRNIKLPSDKYIFDFLRALYEDIKSNI